MAEFARPCRVSLSAVREECQLIRFWRENGALGEPWSAVRLIVK